MSGPSAASSEPIRHRQQLIDSLASGSKPKSAWRIGTEHEKFGFRLDDLRPLTWEGEQGIGALLEGLTRCGWQRVSENGKLIALHAQRLQRGMTNCCCSRHKRQTIDSSPNFCTHTRICGMHHFR